MMPMKMADLASKNAAIRGFTLLEVLLAVFVFSIAVVSLVGAIQQIGTASTDARRHQEIVARLESIMLEITRNPPQQLTSSPDAPFELNTKDAGVDYHVTIKKLELQNQDNAPLQGLYQVRAVAQWMEANKPQDMSAETWFFPPLYLPQ